MVHNIGSQHSIANQFVSELRDHNIQQDPLRFRRNLERLGEVFAYEISKMLPFEEKEVNTPLGVSNVMLPKAKVVLATILRAGLPFHQGLLNYFDNAGNAFISAYRKHEKSGKFDINIEYVSCPELDDTTLIISDPMLATGASMDLALRELENHGKPNAIHIVTVIASSEGLSYIRNRFPKANIWLAGVDEELTAKSYIVPGLGDAGDLAYGEKLQE